MTKNLRYGLVLLMSAAVCLYALGSSVLASAEPSITEDSINEELTLDASTDSDLTTTVTPTPAPTAQPTTGSDAVTRPSKGDVNEDGTVDYQDAAALFQYVTGQSSDINTSLADINEDGVIDLKDVTRLFQYAVGQIDTL
jgi:hypothetical protein